MKTLEPKVIKMQDSRMLQDVLTSVMKKVFWNLSHVHEEDPKTSCNILQGGGTSCILTTKGREKSKNQKGDFMRKYPFNRCNNVPHDGRLWNKIRRIIRIEEPISFEQIRKICADEDFGAVLACLTDMTRSRQIHCRHHWIDGPRGPRLMVFYALDEQMLAEITL